MVASLREECQTRTMTDEKATWWLFPRLREFWENVQQFIPRLPFFFFFFEGEGVSGWRLVRACLGKGQSTVARRAETTVAECSLTSLDFLGSIRV